MNILIFGGCGFVGLNIAVAALDAGYRVMLFDRSPLPEVAKRYFAPHGEAFRSITGDVTDAEAVRQVVSAGVDVIVLGAAITAGARREAADPASILQVNLLAHLPILEAARDHGVRRVINLSSVAAYGATGDLGEILNEDAAMRPVGLYAITKWASERVGERVSGLWGVDFVSVRLSGVFGPWEHQTSVRDTPSPQCQTLSALAEGRPALLARPGIRDWIYAVDVAEAVLAIASTKMLPRKVYNVTSGMPSSVLALGQAMLPAFSGGVCRLAQGDEAPTIDLFGPTDRAPMSGDALADDIGWRARFDVAAAAAHLIEWRQAHGDIAGSVAKAP